jgi:RNA polymerase sigma-70 factor (ECF subfamily)
MVAYGSHTEEAVLIEAAKAGDQEAFRHIVERYQGAVYNLAYRMLGTPEEAEDAAQEIFVRIYRQLGRYDPERKFSTWTLAIATNFCIDQLRRRRMQLVPLENIIPWARTRDSGPEGEALSSESRDEMQRLLKRLPEKYRAPLVLRYWEDLSCAEIAEILGVPEGTIKTQIHRARKQLGKMLEGAEERQDALSRV